MKKFKFLATVCIALVASLVTFSSCSDDGDDSASMLIDKWVTVHEHYYEIYDGEEFGGDYDVTEDDNPTIWTFYKDGLLTDGGREHGNWIIDEWSYEYSNGKLTIFYNDGESDVYTVKKLTKSSLIVELNYVEEDYTLIWTREFKKID